MNKLTSQLLIISLTLFMAVVFVYTLDMPARLDILSVLTVLLIGLSLLLERLRPYAPNWNKNRGDMKGDIASFGVIFVVLDGLLKFGAPFFVIVLLGGMATPSVNMPLWAEIIAVTLLIEFAAYASHWVHHRSRHLWALHATHHSTKRLYTLNNFRFHPINHLINAVAIVIPPLLLGFSQASILGYTALAMPVLILQHANIDLRFGWLNYLLNTNEVHRWHHSIAQREGHCNLGRALVIWDQVFGTYMYPRDATVTVGLSNDAQNSRFPAANNLLAQWRYPFSRACCAKT